MSTKRTKYTKPNLSVYSVYSVASNKDTIMDKCRMTSRDLVQDNIDAIGQLFPNCIVCMNNRQTKIGSTIFNML